MNPNFLELLNALAPEAVLLLGGLVLLAVDICSLRSASRESRLAMAVGVGGLATLVALFLACTSGRLGSVFGGVFMIDSLAVAARVTVLGLTLLVLATARGARSPANPAEFIALLLFAATGILLMASAQQLLVIFLSLELASLSLYVLAGFDKSSRASSEAALKYFLFGGMSAAFLLFGFSLIYGVTGSIELPRISAALAGTAGSQPLVTLALVMIVVAVGFKAAAAPFHLWAPDAYQGAPPAAAALIASASKVGALVLFTRLLWPGLGATAGNLHLTHGSSGWLTVLGVVAAASLLLGNIGALAQTNVRRLLAYSAIAHAGSLLLGLMTARPGGAAPLLYYAATYGLATVGTFMVVAVVDRAGRCQDTTEFAGLARRSPLLAGCLLVFVLSLAGIPPLAGFFGKFFVYSAAFRIGGLGTTAGWLALMAVFLSVVSLYYYLIVLKQALVVPAGENAPKITIPRATSVSLVVAAALVVGLGIWAPVVVGLV